MNRFCPIFSGVEPSGRNGSAGNQCARPRKGGDKAERFAPKTDPGSGRPSWVLLGRKRNNDPGAYR